MDFYNLGKNFINLNKKERTDINIVDEIYIADFLRGYMEINSNLTKPSINKDLKYDDTVILDIFIDNVIDSKIIIDILHKLKIKYDLNQCALQKNNIIYFYIINITFYNVLDILSKLYYPNISHNGYSEEYYSYYMTLSNFHQINFNKETNKLEYIIPKCKYIIEDSLAIVPTKERASDVGYDLSIIKIHKQVSKAITMYDTGIIVIPTYGYYFEVYARSSLSKTGYILANSVGIIDGTFSGTIKVALIKIDQTMPDIKLPFKGMQLILRNMTHFELNKTTKSKLVKTSRGDGGFGCTNKVINN